MTAQIEAVDLFAFGNSYARLPDRFFERGIGNEFVLACDMRFASRQSALFGNPEVGVGLVPGGGALEWLPRVVGRSRALEIVLSGDDFNADIAERYGLGEPHAGRQRPRLVCRYARPASGLVRP
jgi:Enoyl-CoA hydratase/isomerase